MTVYDYGRSPQHWLLAVDIATRVDTSARSVRYADPDDLALEHRYWMQANDFDVAFVDGGSESLIVRRDRLADATDDSHLREWTEPLPSERCFPHDLSLNEAFSTLKSISWLVLCDGKRLCGVVTRDDLAKPAASAFVFAHLINLEYVLRRLIGSYANCPMSDEPEVCGPIPISGEASSAPPVTLRHLPHVVKRVLKIPTLLEELGYTRREFRALGSWAVQLRTHVAHSRGLNHDDPPQPSSLMRFLAVQDLMLRANGLIENRKQVWSAFGESVILDHMSKTIFAGPDASSLPFPVPCFVITASNPFEQTLANKTNQYRNAMLLKCLQMRTEQVRQVVGQSRCGRWKEESFLVAGIDERVVLGLAVKFGQRAIFRLDEEEKLVIDDKGTIQHRASRQE